MPKFDIAKLKTSFSGTIVLPGDNSYETLRTTYVVKNAHPAVIAQATSNKDISATIAFTKKSGLQLSVRSGGHSMAGFSTNNDGLVLDLSLMNSIEVLDTKKGLVRLGSGALWGDVATQLDLHGLAISSGDTKGVAVGGLTLGGGMGWMLRKYGYAIDSLIGAEVVLADGSVVHASETEHSDLFWAVRGGGGNFGVVSSFDFRAHPQGKVVSGILTYAVDDIQKIITGWRDCLRDAPEDLTSFMILMPPGIAGPEPKMAIASCWANENLEQANAAIAPLRKLGTVLKDDVAQKPYAEVLVDGPPSPQGIRLVVKNMFVKTFSDKLITVLNDICCKPGGPIVQLRIVHGAADRVDPAATALPHRNNEAFLFASFPVPVDAAKEQEAQILRPWKTLAQYGSGAYSNFLSTNTPQDVAEVYPENTYERLAEIKRTYDPENIFRHNFNIKP